MQVHFDPLTAIITIIVAPIAYYVLRRVVAFIRANASEVLDAIFYLLGKLFTQSLMNRVSLRRYCRSCLAEDGGTSYLPVPGRETVQLETDSVFVPLVLQAGTGARVNSLIIETLEKGLRARIIGDPGAGKSSLVKKHFRQVARASIYQYAETKLPILLELKRFQPPKNETSRTALGEWALQQTRDVVSSFEGYQMGRLFDTSIAGSGIVLFLDGLDEVSGDNYPQVAIAINELSRILANKSEHNAIILTMRTQFHQQIKESFEEEFPHALHIQPFSPGDMYEFLSRWPFEDHSNTDAVRIFDELTDVPTLREMCSNPLVLAMYVANDQRGAFDSGSPDTRTAFYADVVEELLVRRRSRQVGTQARSRLREQRESLLGKLAAENLLDRSQPANSLSWPRAIELMHELSMVTQGENAHHKFNELAKETGLFSEERPGETFRFIHLTFCEYLAAREFSQGIQDGWEVLLDKHREFIEDKSPQLWSRLVEVIPFCVASVARSTRASALDAMMKVSNGDVQGRCFLETQAYDHPGWSAYRTSEGRLLTDTPPDQWDEVWLKRLHLFNVVLTDERRWRSTSIATQGETFFEQLVRHDKERLTRVFSSFATIDAPAAFRLADAIGFDLVMEQPALIVEGLSNPAFRGVALQRFERSSSDELLGNRLSQWCQIFTIAGMDSEPIADELIALDPTPSLKAAADALPRSKQWFRPGKFPSETMRSQWSRRRILAPSFYTYAISVALSSNEPPPSVADRASLRLLQNLKSPRIWVPTWLILLGLGTMAGILLLFSSGPIGRISDRAGVTTLGLIYGVLGVVLVFGIRYTVGRPFLYAATVNIIPPPSGSISGEMLSAALGKTHGSVPFLTEGLRLTNAALQHRHDLGDVNE